MSDSTKNESPDALDQFFTRQREFCDQGFDWLHASGKAWLEHKILHCWPSGWGDDLQVLIYGDFDPPSTDLNFPSLGIIVHCEKLENTVIQSARCVLKASVTISGKSVDAIVDAGRRINILLGALTLVRWGNDGCGWWSYVTHHSGGGGILATLSHKDLQPAIDRVVTLPHPVRQKVSAALYWIREPRNLMMNFYRSDILRVYVAYWNAFECLVEAINALRPQQKLSKTEKQEKIDSLLEACEGRLTSADIVKCYQEIVNPGFVGKASHALTVCFGVDAQRYIEECFSIPNQANRLYDIRNAINHGDIDAEHPEELVRIESRLSRLWLITWRMFGRLIPFEAPTESPANQTQS